MNCFEKYYSKMIVLYYIELTRINNISSILKNNFVNEIQLYILKAINLANEIYYDEKNFSRTNKIENSISLSDFAIFLG